MKPKVRISHSVEVLKFLVQQVGPDHVLLGTDHPADMADEQAVAHISSLGLSAESQASVLGGAAAELLNLPIAAR